MLPTKLPPDKAPSGGRVLLVDDEIQLLRAYRRVLESAGFEVDVASNGQEALERLSAQRFDVIASDISMPMMSGTDLLRAVRERDVDVPVVLMTANPDVKTAVAAVEHGALRYLLKPFEPRVLQDTITQAVRMHRLARLKREAVALMGEDLGQFGDRGGLEAAFDRALGSLWIAFQPIVTVSQHQILAYEALLRTTEPLLPHPGAVLKAAERLGRLDDLGRLVRTEVARRAPDAPDALLFVNLHPHDLRDEQLYAPSSPLGPLAGRVVLEITERAGLEDLDDVEGRMKALRGMGFRLAIDDLGAGYAGLTSLTQIQPEVVKFDMSLIRDLDSSTVKRRLVQSMTALFKEMDLVVVAEGVETIEERDALAAIGCDVLQGFLFARPGRGFPQPRW
jgi:EAL domain-containing protein (putative c-di-GMP-specific phosphodiesterase class I)